MTLARGRFTDARHAASPIEGRDPATLGSYGWLVRSATADTCARLAFTALGLAVLAAFVVVGSADGSPRAGSAYLAPAAACKGAANPRASFEVQIRAVTCLMNYARAQDSRSRLATSHALERAAVLKGRGVASCGDFSHTPCGSDFTAPVRRAGYRYRMFAENLYAGPWGRVSPREVVSAWLNSPGHRANILGSGFRHVGAAPVRANGLLGGGPSVVWTATFGSPR